MDHIIKAGKKTILAHVNHLKEHGEQGYIKESLAVLKEKHIDIPFHEQSPSRPRPTTCECPSAKMHDFTNEKTEGDDDQKTRQTQLRQWPIQLHLVPPNACAKRLPHWRFLSTVKILTINMSFGLACNRGGASPEPVRLVTQADSALYEAKHGGRNRVCLAGPDAGS